MLRKRYIVCFRIKSVMTFGAVLYILIWLHDIKNKLWVPPFQNPAQSINQSMFIRQQQPNDFPRTKAYNRATVLRYMQSTTVHRLKLPLHTQQPLHGMPETSPMQVVHTRTRWTRLTWLPWTTHLSVTPVRIHLSGYIRIHHQWHLSGYRANRTALPPLKQSHCIVHLTDIINDDNGDESLVILDLDFFTQSLPDCVCTWKCWSASLSWFWISLFSA